LGQSRRGEWLVDNGAWPILTQHALDQVVRTKGVTRSLQPLDLAREPELQALVAAVDEGTSDQVTV
jgi:hypothetical protein